MATLSPSEYIGPRGTEYRGSRISLLAGSLGAAAFGGALLAAGVANMLYGWRYGGASITELWNNGAGMASLVRDVLPDYNLSESATNVAMVGAGAGAGTAGMLGGHLALNQE